ncbi:hypothetical protein [Lentzea cavernae]|uniref:Uncharacterized protein n=1 Tax=Lentzea cavernae TaxID=2020703 RepID=A0ABQ3MIQ7_9PSEU|nr:hypothetical protein [Lentzea cavernae]GHH44041.1 hypothetical protein GCM10017774_42850 [Lentzea cavernae]
MIPEFEVEIDPRVPDQAAYWVPTQDDVSDEGFGFFRNTWLISDVWNEEALAALQTERELLEAVSGLSANIEEYEEIAAAVESCSISELPRHMLSRPTISTLQELVPEMSDEEPTPLEGLELGVYSAVLALNAAGFLTAASCRGHISEHAWATYPVVFFATDKARAQVLQPIASKAGCGFAIDPHRPALLTVYARSSRSMMLMAEMVMENRAQFPEEPLFRYCDDEAPPASGDPSQLPLPGFKDVGPERR